MEYDRIDMIRKIGWIEDMIWDEVDRQDDSNSIMITYLDVLISIDLTLDDMYEKNDSYLWIR